MRRIQRMKTYRNLLWAALTAAFLVSAGLPVRASGPDRSTTILVATEATTKFVSGAVTAKSDSELTVKAMTGETTTVLLTTSTTYSKDGKVAKADDVKVGSAVLVALKTNGDGKTEAEKVTISESMAPKK